jgi:23S rRNA (cytidine1920-2'-O)/16S rRNA (cytidine1409-2'-O)-methyltransferase
MKQTLLQALLAGEHAADEREARGLIMAGKVLVDDKPLQKPAAPVEAGAVIRVKGERLPYVSRGGLKLEAALDHFKVDPQGLNCLDLGSSTGGFTDCLLQRGAARVICIDSGTNQLAWKLRNDPRVTCWEQTSARGLMTVGLPWPPDLIVVDISFSPLRDFLEAIHHVLKSPGGLWIGLIKPQFELAAHRVPQGGVVTDPLEQVTAKNMVAEVAREIGLNPAGIMESPLQGARGNREFLICGRRG